MTTTNKLTDEQWLIQHLEDDAEACSAVNGSKDITTKDARRAEVMVKRLIRERDDACRVSNGAEGPIVVGIDRGTRDQTAMSIGHYNSDGTYTVLSVLHGADADAVIALVAERDATIQQAEAAEGELRGCQIALEQAWASNREREAYLTEARTALTKIADTDVWGQSMHHALNTRIRIATDALAKIAQEDVQ